jgi:hypothetical protein
MEEKQWDSKHWNCRLSREYYNRSETSNANFVGIILQSSTIELIGQNT